MQESFTLRMKYEYYGQFVDKTDKDELAELSEEAGLELSEIIRIQQLLKEKIELYKGSDWDARYGSTGLWRKLFADLQTALLTKCQIDFYSAISCGPVEKEKILRQVLAQINSTESNVLSPDSLLLKAKTTAELSQIDSAYKPFAISQFESLSIKPDIPETIGLQAQLEKIKLTGNLQPQQLDSIARKLAQNNSAGNPELVLSFAFLQRRLNYPDSLEQAVAICPQIRDFLGSLLFSDIERCIEQEQNLEQFSVSEAELAAQAVWKTNGYSFLLEKLSETKKFHRPFIIYSAAYKFAESEPAKAVTLLIEAGSLQQQQKCEKLGLEPAAIARQAALLAYNLLSQEQQNCQLVLSAFENYSNIVKEDIHPELEYLHSTALERCGKSSESKKLLEKIAGRKNCIWSKRAEFDLIIPAIEQHSVPSPVNYRKFAEQLRNLIDGCNEQDEAEMALKMQALTLYCRLLVNSEDESAARKILTALDGVEISGNQNLIIFKSNALYQSGTLDEAVECLLLAADANNSQWTAQAAVLLAEITGHIEQMQYEYAGSANFLWSCKRLARLYYNRLKNPQSGLYLAEITIFTAGDDCELSDAEKLLNNISKNLNPNNIGLLRCRARLSAGKCNFEDGAQLWAKICNLQKNYRPSATEQSRQWWQAKFYELQCWSSQRQTPKEKVLHTIEILENSFQKIPPLWAEKLLRLKQRCKNQPAPAKDEKVSNGANNLP